MKGRVAKRGKKISAAEFARLWYDLSIPVWRIGEMLGISRYAVLLRAKARGLPGRRTIAPDIVKSSGIIRALWRLNVSTREIADHLNLSEATVRERAKRMGLIPRPRHTSDWCVRMADLQQRLLADAMAKTARQEQAAMINAEMADSIHGAKLVGLDHARGRA